MLTRETDPLMPGSLCGEAEFAEVMEGMVATFAPRLFAIVQEYGERVDGRIAAWGMAFADNVEVVGVDGRLRLSMRSPERALMRFGRRPHVSAHVVWVNPDAADQPESS
jgi:hypothetical protein